MFFVKEPDAGVNLFTVSRIKNSIKRDSILFFQICLTGKMKVAVPEPVNSLIILLISGGIENTGISLEILSFYPDKPSWCLKSKTDSLRFHWDGRSDHNQGLNSCIRRTEWKNPCLQIRENS